MSNAKVVSPVHKNITLLHQKTSESHRPSPIRQVLDATDGAPRESKIRSIDDLNTPPVEPSGTSGERRVSTVHKDMLYKTINTIEKKTNQALHIQKDINGNFEDFLGRIKANGNPVVAGEFDQIRSEIRELKTMMQSLLSK